MTMDREGRRYGGDYRRRGRQGREAEWGDRPREDEWPEEGRHVGAGSSGREDERDLGREQRRGPQDEGYFEGQGRGGYRGGYGDRPGERFGHERGERRMGGGEYPEQDWGPTYGSRMQEGQGGWGSSQGYGRGGGFEGGRGEMGRGAGRDRDTTQPSYAGRGPKGYRRSDERLKEDACDRLERDPMLDASEIELDVREGVVVLTGTVRTRQDKRRAEELLDDMAGVRDVDNQIKVQRQESGSGSGRESSTASGSSSKQGKSSG